MPFGDASFDIVINECAVGILTPAERLRTIWRILRRYGPRGVFTALRNERMFYRTILDGSLGYGLYWGVRP